MLQLNLQQRKKKARVLFVDLDAACIDSIQQSFKSPQFQLVFARTDEEAITCSKDSNINVVVLNFDMPDGLSIEIYRKIIKHTPNPKTLKFIATVDSFDSTDFKKAQEFNINYFIKKPIDLSVLQSKLELAHSIDHSDRYYKMTDQYLLFRIPNPFENWQLDEMREYLILMLLKAKNLAFLVMDLSAFLEIDSSLMECINKLITLALNASFDVGFIANETVTNVLKSQSQKITPNMIFANSAQEISEKFNKNSLHKV